MAVRRDIVLVGVKRLVPTKKEVGGWPPILATFHNFYDREAVLRRADMVQQSGMRVTVYY